MEVADWSRVDWWVQGEIYRGMTRLSGIVGKLKIAQSDLEGLWTVMSGCAFPALGMCCEHVRAFTKSG